MRNLHSITGKRQWNLLFALVAGLLLAGFAFAVLAPVAAPSAGAHEPAGLAILDANALGL